jgi:hypothetical protein
MDYKSKVYADPGTGTPSFLKSITSEVVGGCAVPHARDPQATSVEDRRSHNFD